MREGMSHDPRYSVVSSATYESGPPSHLIRVPDSDVMETVKEEAWEERKKKTTKTTRNIEKRVQRQLILEDGVLKEDSGPVITEDATEDTVVKEEVSNENQQPQHQIEGPEPLESEGWIPVAGGIIISEKNTTTINSHDELEDELETEEIQHCGDVTNQEAESYVVGENDIKALVSHRQSRGLQLSKPQKRTVHEASRRRGNVDTVDVKENSRIQDGHVYTETEKTVKREEYDHESAPDSDASISDGSVHEKKKETSHNLVHTKDEDLLEYYAVPKGKSLAQGVKLGEGMHVVSEDVHEDKQGDDTEPIEEKYRIRRNQKRLLNKDRSDALTRKPIDFGKEEATRKKETNRWLENHFGSESGHSVTSSQDLNETAEKGNRIKITMSPHPAVNQDEIDSGCNRYSKWTSGSNIGLSSKIPPPPPPKPTQYWGSNNSYTPPRSPAPPSYSSKNQNIHETEIASARSKLRTTGMNLTDDNKENYPVQNTTNSYSRKYTRENAVRGSRDNIRESSPEQKRVFFPASLQISQRSDEPVYTSRFSSGNPKKLHYEPESPPRRKYSSTKVKLNSSPDYPVMETRFAEIDGRKSPTNVGRSQSFNITSLPWSKKKKSKANYKSENYRSEERLDDVDNNRHRSMARRLFDRLSPSKEIKSSSRKTSPKRNLMYSSDKYRSHQIDDIFARSPAREIATQTAPSPVPPPRNRKKHRPKHTYFFGLEESSNSSQNYDNYGSNTNYNTNGNDDPYKRNYSTMEPRYKSYNTSSPSTDTRYKTKKTFSAPITSNYETTTSKTRYYGDNESDQNWTKTLDPRRKPRHTPELDRPSTLPRKQEDNSTYGGGKYFYGQSDVSNRSNRLREKYLNEQNNYISRDREPIYKSPIVNEHLGNSGNVGRSQSFNVQAKTNFRAPPEKTPSSFANMSEHKTSTRYSSTPYLNLRSPNMIASIARSSSIRDLENQQPPQELEKRTQFMEGLLNTAPELYHFMHGEDRSKTNINHDTTGSRYNIRGSSDVLTPTSPTGKVFTFGKDYSSLARSSSGGSMNPDLNKRTTSLINLNSPTNTMNGERKTRFNLKTSGASLLLSPSFRDKQRKDEERRKYIKTKNRLLNGDSYERSSDTPSFNINVHKDSNIR